MEEILEEISRDATSARLKHLKEACVTANDYLFECKKGKSRFEPHELRQQCLLPFKFALESRTAKLASLALSGLQKLMSDERFRSTGEEGIDYQLPVQFLNTIIATPTFSDDIQVEVMKLLLIISCSASCEIHGEHLIDISEICFETYIRSHQNATKNACRATLIQMLTSVCHRLQDSLIQKGPSIDTKIKRKEMIVTDASKVLSQDVVLLLKHFSSGIQAADSAQQNGALPLYLDAIHVILRKLSIAMQQEKDFVNVIWQDLCPSLIQLLGSPISDVGKRSKVVGYPGYSDDGRGLRGPGRISAQTSMAKIVYGISAELVRLIGSMASLRPTLESLFHRIILYPPPKHRIEALKVIKEIFCSPERMLDLAGPTQNDREPGSPESPTEQKRSDMDLFKLIMDGIQEASHCNDAAVCSASVACTVALLGTLEELSCGTGLMDEHIEMLEKIVETENWQEAYIDTQKDHDNAASARQPNLISGNLEDTDDEEYETGHQKMKPKHIRWQLEEGKDETSVKLIQTQLSSVNNLKRRGEGEREERGHQANKVQKLMIPHKKHTTETAAKIAISNKVKNCKKQGKELIRTPAEEEKFFTFENQSEEDQVYTGPKTVTWAAENEERIIENREDLKELRSRRSRQKHSLMRTKIPRASSRNSNYANIKPRTDTGLKQTKHPAIYSKGHTKASSSITDIFMNIADTKVHRSSSSIDIRPKRTRYPLCSPAFPLRKTKSLGDIFAKYTKHKSNKVNVDYEYFENTIRSRLKYEKGGMKKPRTSLGFPRLSIDITRGGRKFIQPSLSREKSERGERDVSFKTLRPILRRSKLANESDKHEIDDGQKSDGELRPHDVDSKRISKWETPKSPSKETTINGIPLSKLPKQGTQATSKKSTNKKDDSEKKSIEEDQKEGARNFARCLLGILPSVLTLNEPQAVDEALQQFASDVCEAVCCMALKRKNVPNFGTLQQQIDGDEEADDKDPLLNADGVYLTVLETLTLNYKLNKSGYYKKKDINPAQSQEQFVRNITDSGIVTRLSEVWLSEVYRLVTTYDILTKAGYKLDSSETNRALINILSGSLYEKQPGRFANNGKVLSPGIDQENLPPSKREGMKFARKLLFATWDSVLEIVGVPLDTSTKIMGNGSVGLALMLGTVGHKEKLFRESDLICLSLDGFRRAARLCCTLGIQTRCEIVLARLADASCGEHLSDKKLKSMCLASPLRLHAAHVLSMDALLAAGLELGVHAPKCWSHVFRCCLYISHLEHAHFNSSESSSVASLSLPLNRLNDLSPTSDTSNISEDNVSVDTIETSSDTSKQSTPYNGVLSPEDASRAIYALSSAVDNLFETASNTLTLNALLEFLKSLINASQKQLFDKSKDWKISGEMHHGSYDGNMQQYIPMNTLHLYHICDVMLRCARNNNRTLLHLMEAWLIVSPHLVEAACHRGRHISKVALTSTHDILSEVLKRRNESPHFWFHDSLFKPFESLLSFEVYDEDIQDQVLYTIYELVEGFGSSIKSGWCSLFGALRNTQIYHRRFIEGFDDGNQRQSLLFHIIDNFTNIKSAAVFASSAIDCILCLLKFLRGHDNIAYDTNDDSRSETESLASENSTHDLCLPSLNALSNISKRLASVYLQPSSAIFRGSYSIVLVDLSQAHDKVWDDNWSNTSGSSGSDNEMKVFSSTAKSISAIDDTGILRVWFLLLEGLTSAIGTCPRRFQVQTIDLLFEILRSISTVPGPHFSMFAITHLLLPMLQSWVQKIAKHRHHLENTFNNFKHACGQATQLVVEEMRHFISVEGANECVPTMIKLLLDLYIECVSQPFEAVARLGCSCLRHLLMSAGPQFSEDLWYNVCKGVKQIINATLSNLKELIVCFQPGSTSIAGDNGMHVKVVARKDLTPQEASRFQQIAEQVFLLESQIGMSSPRKIPDQVVDEDDQRSYIFVLSLNESKDKSEAAKTRIPLKSIMVGLLANQILIHTLGSILLENSDTTNPFPNTILASITESGLVQRNQDDSNDSLLPGLLCYLSPVNLGILFDCLLETSKIAQDFNARPGLRALIQKLGKLPAPANLLRQSITSTAYYLNTLFQISRHDGENISISHIKRILTGERSNFVSNDGKKIQKEEGSPGADKHKDLLKGGRNIDWIIHRLYEACNQLSNMYIKMHLSEMIEQDSGIDSFSSSFSTPVSSPFKGQPRPQVTSSQESLETIKFGKQIEMKENSPFRFPRLRKEDDGKYFELDSRDSIHLSKQQNNLMRRRDDEIVHLNAWSHLVINILELLLALPTLQFKSVLPAVFPSVTSLVTTVQDHRVRQLVCNVVRRCGAIYGIV